VLQQPLVDAAEVLHRKVAVVDPASAGAGLRLARHGLDDVHQHRVRQRHAGKNVVGMVTEQAAVVLGQAKGRVSARHCPRQGEQPRPFPGSARGEGDAAVHLASRFRAHPLKAVVPVAGMLHRQQIAIHGVK